MPYTQYPSPVSPEPSGMLLLPQLDGSVRTIIDERAIDRTNSGTVKQRSFYPTAKYAFSLRHRFASQAHYEDFITFYQSYRRLAFSFRFAGESAYNYTCVFDSRAPVFVYSETRIDATVQLLQV